MLGRADSQCDTAAVSQAPAVPDELAARRRAEEHEAATPVEGVSGSHNDAVAVQHDSEVRASLDASSRGSEKPVTGSPAASESGGAEEGADEVVAAEHRAELADVLVDFAQDLLADFSVELVLRNLCEPALGAAHRRGRGLTA